MGVYEGVALASRSRRLVAWLVDCAVLSVFLVPAHLVVWLERPGPAAAYALFAATVVVIIAYKAVFEGSSAAATPGKRLLRVHVADARAHGSIGYRRSTLRAVGFVIGAWALYIGWLWALFNARRQGWHDLWAHSLVIRAD